MKTFVVIFPLKDNRDARKQAEEIENTKFEIKKPKEGYPKITSHKVRKAIYDLLEVDDIHINVFTLTYFMDEINEDNLNSSDFFISYVHAKMINEKRDKGKG